MAEINSSFEISLDSLVDSEGDFPVMNEVQEFAEKSTDPFVDKIMLYYLKHNWTLVGLEDVMDLINDKLEECEKLPTAKKQIIKLFRKHRDLVSVFFFVDCKKCKTSTKIDSESANCVKCDRCDNILTVQETNFFVYIPIEQQIIKSVNDNWQYISNFDTSGNKESYTDVHDGAILRNLLDQYSDSDVNILSMCLNIDGANKFKSNLLSVWPIQLMQNYLPPNIRFLPDNMIVAGLYYHKNKPNCLDYLLPLINEMTNLKDNNIKIEIGSDEFKFMPVITSCAVDLPAKSLLQEIKQYGGYDSCTFCEIKGELVTFEKKKNGNDSKKKKNIAKKNTEDCETNKFVRYVEGNEIPKLRDEKETLEKMLAVASSSNKKAVDGVKGVSCLVSLDHFNIVHSISVEYMHCILLGDVKRLINYFCNPTYKTKSFYIAPRKRKALNGKILRIKPTSSIVRKPRSLDQRRNFKASEFRSLLLYYLPICLPGHVPNEYVEHIRLLSAAVYTLLKANIPKGEVDDTEQMLNRFVKDHQKLFGKCGMVMNVHLVKHLCESVRQLGPLWCHSAFPFERNNGCLLKMVNGTTDVLYQMSSKYALKKSLKKNFEMNETDPAFCGRSVPISEKTLSVVNYDSLTRVNLSNEKLQAYKRLKIGKTIYTSKLYTRPKKSVDYFIQLEDERFGAAKFYLESNGKKYVIMEEYEIIDTIYHIDKVQKTNTTLMAAIEVIQKKLIFMQVGLNNYITSPPNPYENE